MAISSLPSCASHRFLPHRGCTASIPALPLPGPSAASSSSYLLAFPPLPSPAGFLAVRVVTGAQGGKVCSSLGGSHDPALLRRPLVSPQSDGGEKEVEEVEQQGSPGGSPEDADGSEGGEDGRPAEEARGRSTVRRKEEEWGDWEDQILEDTVPLVSFIKMLLHSGKYESGERLSPEHEKAVLERLLPYHPEFEKKIGCGVDYITVGYHPDFENSRCLFLVRKDGESVDFSYWKCVKGLIRKKHPLYADSFILRHFRRHRHNNE